MRTDLDGRDDGLEVRSLCGRSSVQSKVMRAALTGRPCPLKN